MAYYYVKSGGTASGDTGRETTKRTGTFESDANNYASISAAMSATTTPTGGDYILCSSAHNHTYSTNTTITGPDPTAGNNPINVRSVDNSNQENYLAGAKEQSANSNNSYLYYRGCWHFKGVDIETWDEFWGSQASGTEIRFVFEDAQIDFGHENVGIGMWEVADINYIVQVIMRNVHFNHLSRNDLSLNFMDCFDVLIENCTFQNNASGNAVIMTAEGRNRGQSTLTVRGCDFGTNDTIVECTGDMQNGLIILERNKHASGATLVNRISRMDGGRIICHGNYSDSANNYLENGHILEVEPPGTWETNTATYRNGQLKDQSSGGMSIKFTPDGTYKPRYGLPATFKLSDIWLDNSSAKTIRVDFSSATASLDDQDVAMQIRYPGSGAKELFNNTLSDDMGSASGHSAGSGWTSSAGNDYYMEDTLTASKEGLVEVWVSVHGDYTVYFDLEVTVT